MILHLDNFWLKSSTHGETQVLQSWRTQLGLSHFILFKTSNMDRRKINQHDTADKNIYEDNPGNVLNQV